MGHRALQSWGSLTCSGMARLQSWAVRSTRAAIVRRLRTFYARAFSRSHPVAALPLVGSAARRRCGRFALELVHRRTTTNSTNADQEAGASGWEAAPGQHRVLLGVGQLVAVTDFESAVK